MDSTYEVVMGRSENIGGPYLNKDGESWVDNKSSLFLTGNKEEPGRGHNGIFAAQDTTYVVYHAYTKSADGKSLLNIKPLYMTSDEWPTLEPTNRLFEMDNFQKQFFHGK